MKLTPKVIASGVAVYFATAVGAYLYLRGSKASKGACGCAGGDGGHEGEEEEQLLRRRRGQPVQPLDSTVWSRLAAHYDREIDMDERVMGIKLLRWWLIRQARGDVLEVSAGTGRNLKYYDLHCGVQSLTLTDGNKQMLQTAYDKFRDMGKEPQARVRFTLADAQSLSSSGAGSSSDVPQEAPPQTAQQEPCFGPQVQAPAAFAPQQFDYVVDTFGLCSCDDPVQALKEMARVCKPGGRLLLLEHGRGSWNFVNGILDGGEEAHCKKWGCKWNRPIAELVAQAGLDVESLTRWHFGTTYVITARPKQVSQAM